MARGPLDFLGGLLEGLSRLPQSIFGGKGIGGLLEGLFGGGKRRTYSPGAQSAAKTFMAPPGVQQDRPVAVGPRKQRPSPSTVIRAPKRAVKSHPDWKKNPLLEGC